MKTLIKYTYILALVVVLSTSLSGCAGMGSGLNQFPSIPSTNSGTLGFPGVV